MIRTYTHSDEQDVTKLWKECHLLSPANNPKQDIQRKCNENPELFFVMEEKGRIIGSCLSGYDGHRGWIYYLAISPDHRKKGLGEKLVAHAEQALKKIGCPKIDLMVRDTNKGVIDFYHRIGYHDDPVVVLSKRLSEDEPYQM